MNRNSVTATVSQIIASPSSHFFASNNKDIEDCERNKPEHDGNGNPHGQIFHEMTSGNEIA